MGRSTEFCRADSEGWGPFNSDRTDFTLCFEYSVYSILSGVALLLFGARIIYLRTTCKPHLFGRTAWIYWPSQAFSALSALLLFFQAFNEATKEEAFAPDKLIGTSLTALAWTWPRGSTRVQQLSGAQAWDKANFYSRWSQHYFQPIVSLAAKQRMLFPSDIVDQLPERHKTENGYARISTIWNNKLKRYNDKIRAAGGSTNIEAVKKIKKPSLMVTILQALWKGLIPIIVAKTLVPFLEYLSPFLLGIFLDYIQGTSGSNSNSAASHEASLEEKPLGYGLLLAIEVKAALTAMIYRKTLVLSPDSRRKSSTGAILNHMSFYIHQLLGWSFLAGVFTIVAFIPFQSWRAKVFEGLEEDRLKATDERVRLTTEVLSSIKIVKLYGWEAAFKRKVLGARAEELKVNKKIGALEAIMSLVFASTSTIVTFVTFATYVTIGRGTLTPKIVFVSLTLFDMLHEPVHRLAEGTATTIALVVATKRIQRFLMREEIDSTQILHEKYDEDSKAPVIEIENATLAWTSNKTTIDECEDENDEDNANNDSELQQPLLNRQESTDILDSTENMSLRPTLRNVTFSIKDKSLTAIVGRVGQGKSSILNAIIGEMYKLDGTIRVRGRIAYIPQQAFIINATIRDNIIFGNPFDQDRYRRVLTACGLDPDLDSLPAGDMTEIGERGINLSGGQKQRVSLARATYDNADIYLLDDPLSAVDAHVDRHLWDNLIGPKGLLRNKTRILVTHGIHHLEHVDKIIVFKDGEITESGRYEDLIAAKKSFYQLMKEYSAKHSRRKESHAHIDQPATAQTSNASSHEITEADSVSTTDLESDVETVEETFNTKANAEKDFDEEEDELIAEEVMKKGGVERRLIKIYGKACGLKTVFGIIFLIIVGELCTVATNLWLKFWVDRTKEELEASIGLFLVMLLVFALFFYDTTPLGRIMNRFSGDCYSVDEHLPWKCLDLGYLLTAIAATILIVSFSTPAFLLIVPFIAFGFYLIADYFLWATRSLKRFNSVSVSPIYQHFDETLNGLTTIRAMGIQQRFIEENAKRTDYNANAYSTYSFCNRWVDIRLQVLSASIILAIALLGVLGRYTIEASVLGLSMSFAMGITDSVMWLCRDFSEWQSHLIAIERIREYTDKHTEAPEFTSKVVPDLWPAEGRVIFKDYSTRYREGLGLVLKHLSVEIQPREKIGIVGRTGAGKSSLTLALFRIIEAANSPWARASDNSGYHDKKASLDGDDDDEETDERQPLLGNISGSNNITSDGIVNRNEEEEINGGSIEIDGIDIATIGLMDLRKHLAIIPQDPTLFAGTIRDNLDPFHEMTDADLWEALDRAHLKTFVRSNLSGGLSAEVTQNGENFSIGQRSLICLARALLRKSKILILDEATAAVDVETDELIQRTIREEFKDRTVLTIAHRIKTVMDSDRILVMEQGRIVEFEAPKVLLQREDSLFFKLAQQAGEVAPSSLP
ncbi:hypothetical protein FBU30_000306 [Linnemannia zychae]|nr:hypothetical protein FBU30_000306 [Linnemannia zychae]